jgi:hypothetical protein
LHLAPDIQEALLFRTRPERGRDCLGLRHVLPLTKVLDWHKQRRMWRGLYGQGLNVAATGRKRGVVLATRSVILRQTVSAGRRSLLKDSEGVRIKFSGCEADAKNLQHSG